MRYTCLNFFIASLAIFAEAQAPIIIKDINPSNFQSGIPHTLERAFAAFDGKVYFTADDGVTGTELWVTDGTGAGTMLVKDINEGPEGSDSQKFYVTGSQLFFLATDEEHGTELWVTDGTESGTTLVKDSNPGPSDGPWFSLAFTTDYMVWDDMLFFACDDGNAGIELWRSDGTGAGTFMIKDINPGNGDSMPWSFAIYDGKLYFNAGGLWVSDGTEAGTEMVSALIPEHMIATDEYLYFSASDGINNFELWRSDGTEAGTQLVKEINPNSPNGSSINCGTFDDINLVPIGNVVFFSADDGTGRELWRSDGTENGTYKVIDASPDEFSDCTTNMVVLDDMLYYGFNDDEHGHELWRSDGTESGTYMVKDILEGENGSFQDVTPTQMIAVGDKLVFGAGEQSVIDVDLWISDGTDAGTNFLGGLSESMNPDPKHFTLLNDECVIFTAESAFGGYELWKLTLLESNSAETFRQQFQIGIRPSIASSQFTIDATGVLHSNSFDVKLMSLAGLQAKQWSEVIPGQGLDIHGISPGTYFVQISNENGFATEKLIITN